MKAVNRLLVHIVVVKLGVVVGFHKLPAGEFVDHGRDSGYGHGEIVGPGLDGAEHLHPVGVGRLVHLNAFQKTAQEILVLVGTAHRVHLSVGMGRKLEI